MNSKKIIAFMEKLLERTKSGEIKWDRMDIHHQVGVQSKCFYCSVGDMNIYLITLRGDSEEQFLRVSYDSKLPSSELKPANEDERVMLLRLFNYVYSLFPNLETSIDKFLNDF